MLQSVRIKTKLYPSSNFTIIFDYSAHKMMEIHKILLK